MKLATVNKLLLVLGLMTLITGLVLHFDYPKLHQNHAAEEFWKWSHIIIAALLVIIATIHMVKNKWWLRALKSKIARTRVLAQRLLTPAVVLLFLSLIVTGVCMLCGWYPRHSNIWGWHFWLGIAWAAAAIGHAIAFHVPKHPSAHL